MPDGYRGASGDEELAAATGSPWWTRFAFGGLALVVVVSLTVYALTHGHSSAPAVERASTAVPELTDGPQVIARAVLVPGRAWGSDINATDGDVDYSAELINATPDELSIGYPILFAHATNAPVTVRGVVLAPQSAGTNVARLPPKLTTIAAHEHVMLWIRVHVDCRRWDAAGTRLRWPGASAAIVVRLAGLRTVVTFPFTDLFNADEVPVIPDQVCPARKP